MRESSYRDFSLKTHNKNRLLNNPNLCQFELTFKCGLHCKHCYTDCYNRLCYTRRELNTEEVKLVLDKIYKAGVIWLCFTGGDSLTRKDFFEIYAFAKQKGFIISIFTNGYSLTQKAIQIFKEKPPFAIEITLNAVTEDLYERISQVNGSFVKVMRSIQLAKEAKLPLKLKTLVTKNNFAETPKIKKFVQRLGLNFLPSYSLFAALNGDTSPCELRITPGELSKLFKRGKRRLHAENCSSCAAGNQQSAPIRNSPADVNLFHCAIGCGDGFQLDPYGNMFLCAAIRKPSFNLLNNDVKPVLNKLLLWAKDKKFNTESQCKNCNRKDLCFWCPGKAYLETGDLEKPIEYYCKVARGIGN